MDRVKCEGVCDSNGFFEIGVEKSNSNSPADYEAEAEKILLAMGCTPAWKVEDIKQTAMNVFNVPKGKRAHVKRILDWAFDRLHKEAS